MLKTASTIEPVLRAGLLVVVCCLAIVVVLSLAYSLFLLLVAAVEARRRRRAGEAEVATDPTRFLILIPAHDEELVLPATLRAISQLDYPTERLRVVVIADNCCDGTAELAGKAGAEVLERAVPLLKSKGYALNWALEKLLPSHDFDLVVIIDADTHMDRGFLRGMDRAYREQPAQALFAAQGFYDVLNAGEGWRAALMGGALKLVHYVRPLARERLGLSAGLKGNGMCLSAPILSQTPWRGDSLTEDIEYALDLAEGCGQRVRFVPQAIVRAQMPTTARGASSQRRRWEHGRYHLMRTRGLPLLWRGIVRRNRLAFDLALDLFVLPLAEIASCWALWGLLLLAALHLGWLSQEFHWLLWAWAASALALLVYVFGGLAVARAPRAAYLALACAPAYIVWKMLLYVARKRGEGWVRTERGAPANAATAPVAASVTPAERMEAVNE